MKNVKYKKEKKDKIKISGIVVVHIKSTFNNTIITAQEEKGEVFAWASSGSAGFKNTKEATPFAAQSAAEILVNKMKSMGVYEIKISMKGLGAGREAVLKTLAGSFKVLELKDATPIAFNGCRLPKARRS